MSQVSLDDEKLFAIYHGYCENLRYLKGMEKTLRRQLNSYLRLNKRLELENSTKMYAVLFVMTAEAHLMKLLSTPSGFSPSEASSILNQRSLENKWEQCIALAAKRTSAKKSNYGQNVDRKLREIADALLISNLAIRNRIAHGQTIRAFSNDSWNTNSDITESIRKLDYASIAVSFRAMHTLSDILNDLIQSPNKAHFRDYWGDLCKLERELEAKELYSVDSAKAILEKKRQKR